MFMAWLVVPSAFQSFVPAEDYIWMVVKRRLAVVSMH